MSVELAVGPVEIVRSIDVPHLTILLDSVDPSRAARAGTASVHDAGFLVDRILRSRSVLIEQLDSSPPVVLTPRTARESDAAWLTRVLVAVLEQNQGVRVACDLVGSAINLTSSYSITIECRIDWTNGDHRMAASRVLQRPGRSMEFPLLHSARGTWVIVHSGDSMILQAEYATLLAALTRRLSAADAEAEHRENLMWGELFSAVSRNDPTDFVATAGRLLGGSVSLLDSAGTVVAGHMPVLSDRAQEFALRDESGVRGALVVVSGRRSVDPGRGLVDLAMTLLRVHETDRERDELANRVSVLSCFVERDMKDFRAALGARPRRIVMIAPGSGQSSGSRVRKPDVGLILRAAASVPQLATLSLARHGDYLVGAYCDDDDNPEAHRKNWQRLMAAVDRPGSMVVAVSRRASNVEETRLQQANASQIISLQRDAERYFNLPAVIVIDQLGPLAGVIGAVPGSQVVPFIQRVLGDLLADPRFGGELVDTLYAYLQAGGSPRDAGVLLHLHESSVKYRMRVVRELLGDRLTNPSERFELELALRLHLAGRKLAGTAL